MKTNQQTKEELKKEFDDLLHPERHITKWIRIKFWFMNLDIKFYDAIGKIKQALKLNF
jgi:hypothetical protein